MKGIERHNLVDTIARTLQSRMTYSDIDHYFEGFGIKPKTNRSYDSKWVYVKDVLAGVKDELVVQIADELEIPHVFTVVATKLVIESKFWEPNHFRLFLSHISPFKVTTAQLRTALRKFAISGFVAHEDIEPTKEWQDEIEAALFSMDALAAIITPHFCESKWADQEVGVAFGRGVLIIPVMREAAPHGFIGKFQGINGDGKTVNQVADSIFRVLLHSPQTRGRLLTCMVDAAVLEQNETAAHSRLELLESIEDVPKSTLERLRDGALRSQLFAKSAVLTSRLSELLKARGVALSEGPQPESEPEQEAPF